MSKKKKKRKDSKKAKTANALEEENLPARRKKDKQLSFWVTDEQRDAIRTYASEHDMSVSRLIIEGLEMRMKRE